MLLTHEHGIVLHYTMCHLWFLSSVFYNFLYIGLLFLYVDLFLSILLFSLQYLIWYLCNLWHCGLPLVSWEDFSVLTSDGALLSFRIFNSQVAFQHLSSPFPLNVGILQCSLYLLPGWPHPNLAQWFPDLLLSLPVNKTWGIGRAKGLVELNVNIFSLLMR